MITLRFDDLTVTRAAALAGVSSGYMRRLLQQGVIANRGQRGMQRLWLVDPDSFAAWQAQRRRKGGRDGA